MKKYFKKRGGRIWTILTYVLLLGIGMFGFGRSIHAQVATCDSLVPYFYVDLTGDPAGQWTSPTHSREGHCCGSITRCTSFEVLLDSNAAMVEIGFDLVNDPSQALPAGALYYQIGCGPEIPVGEPICITGVGPHHITFCKPGNNTNTYYVRSISKPLFPPDDTVRVGCSHPLEVLGMDTGTVTWQSISPGAPGDYDSLLSCTNCENPVYNAVDGVPDSVDFLICGYPIADECGYVGVCDTIRIYNFGRLTGDVTPDTAIFCAGGSGVLIEAEGFGGNSPYNYLWRDESSIIVSDSSTFLATTEQSYQVEIWDALYNPNLNPITNQQYCPSISLPVLVIVTDTAIVDAGPNQTLCYNDALVFLNGSADNTDSVEWSGGSGTYSLGNNTSVNSIYIPDQSEISDGFVTLYLTGYPSGYGCNQALDSVTIFFTSPIIFNMPSQNVLCYGDSAILTPNITGGSFPYAILWGNGSVSTSIEVPQGNYCLAVTDNNGCVEDTCINVVAPPALTLGTTSSDATSDGASDGFAVALPGGGTIPYTFLWDDPLTQTNDTAFNLSYGLYNVTLTDLNGCQINTFVVVNEPRCSTFTGTLLGFDPVTCFGGNNGSAWLDISGGLAPYQVFWSDPLVQTNDTAFNLSAGVYQAYVVDANLCHDLINVSIPEPAFLYTVINQTNVSTEGGNDGAATSNPFGGTPGYTYLWTDSLGNTVGNTPTITGLTAGWYTILLTDTNGCTYLDSALINQPPCNNLVVSTGRTNVTCAGMSTGSVTVTVLLGLTPYQFTWRDALNNIIGTNDTVVGLPAGTYSIEVIDSNNCEAYATVVITEPSPLNVIAAETHPSCNESTNGTIEVTVSGGVYPYSYLWNDPNGSTVQDLYNLNTGSYTVIVTDANGCTNSASTIMVPPAPITGTISFTPVTCYGDSNGTINVSVFGGISPYNYSWSNSETTEDLTDLPSNTYTVAITDQNGCAFTNLAALVSQPLPILNDSTFISCPVPGSGVALVQFFPSGGSESDYQLSFDNGVTFDGIDSISAFLPVDSTYIIVIRDSNNCVSYVKDTISILPEVAIASITFDRCTPANATSTFVQVTISGGAGPDYQVSFDNGSNYNLDGVYSDSVDVNNPFQIVVRDSIGCISVMDSIFIPAPIDLSGTISLYNGVNVSCNGFSDGSIDANMLGWTTPYDYLWSNTETTQDIDNLVAGGYSLIVTDANNCKDTIDFNLSQPLVLNLSTIVTTDFNGYAISCYGLSDAGIDLTIAGGTSPYQSDWSNGSVTEDISGISANTYEVLVTDTNGCLDSISVVITQPDSIQLTYIAQDILCNTFSTGSINVTAVGGVSINPYLFDWSSGQSSEDLLNIPAGTYDLMLTDNNGCEDSISVTLSEPTDISVSAITSDVLCYNDSTGNIDITVVGGTGSYSYDWSNGTASQDLLNIPDGTYTVIVYDANNCTDTTSYSIAEPADLIGTIFVSSDYNGFDVSCFGSSDGAIDVTINGGITPYNYLWSTSDTTQDLSGLPVGDYLVVVRDSNNCMISLPITLTGPTQLATSGVVDDVLCFGFSNGAIDLTVTGGADTTYAYNWNNSEITEDLSSLDPGNYSVTVTDINGCTSTYTAVVNELAPVIISATATNPSCFGFDNGGIDVSMTGGMGPYTYTWSTGSNNQDLDSLVAGDYILTVVDSNNCSAVDTISVFEPFALALDLSSPLLTNGYNISYFGGSDGFVYSTLNGGTAPYAYTWSNGDTGPDLSNITAGTYYLTVVDDNGCLIGDSIIVTQPDSLEMPTGFTPNNDGYNDGFIVHGIDNYPDNYLTVINRWGNVVFEQPNYNNTWAGESSDGLALPDGTYFVILEVRNINVVLKSYVDIRR